MKTNTIKDLRPVEALYLLSDQDKEEWSEEYALAATLVYLAQEGYIKPEGKDDDKIFVLTKKGEKNTEKLRGYEKDCLEAIADEDDSGILDSVYDHDFDELMTEKEFFKAETRRKGWWIFKWDHTDYKPTEKYHKAQKELDELKGKIQEEIKKKGADPYLMSMSYAFPSAGLTDGFLEYAENLSDSVAASHAATQAAINAVVLMTVINTINTTNTITINH